MKKGFTLIELMIVVAIIAIIAAIAIPNLLESRMTANEANAVAALKQYATAQAIYKKTNYGLTNVGATASSKYYATSFTYLGGTTTAHVNGDGTRIKLLSGTFAAATGAATAYQGYFFTADASLVFADYLNDFALFADPAAYAKSGQNTFHIDGIGIVKQKDLGSAGSAGTWTEDTSWVVP